MPPNHFRNVTYCGVKIPWCYGSLSKFYRLRLVAWWHEAIAWTRVLDSHPVDPWTPFTEIRYYNANAWVCANARDCVTGLTVCRAVLLLCCHDCDSTQQHYDVTRRAYVLWRHTMHEWVMHIQYQAWIAKGRFANIIRMPSKQWGMCDNDK